MKYEIDSIIFSDIDNCDPNPCLNGGVCTNGNNFYTCNCKEGHSGKNCTGSMFHHIDSFKINLVLVGGDCDRYLQVVKNALLEIWLYFLFGNTFDKV